MIQIFGLFFFSRYELIQKGITELRASANVPDVYSQVMLLENENKNLRKDVKHYKQAAEYVIFQMSFVAVVVVYLRLSKCKELNRVYMCNVPEI